MRIFLLVGICSINSMSSSGESMEGNQMLKIEFCTYGSIMRSNLVDSASSHTLVSKIKPCTSKYKSFTLKLRMAHYISYSLFDSPLLLG